MRLVRVPVLFALLVLISCDQTEPPGGGEPSAPPPALAAAYDAGLDFLRTAAPEGNYQDPGLAALAATPFLMRPGSAREGDAGFMDGCLEYVLGFQKETGGIFDRGLANYTTCAAILAMAESGDERYAKAIENAAGFLKTLQSESGGIGYSDKNPGKPDLSNTQFAIESLRAAGVPADDPHMSKALQFLQSVQNRSESNNAAYQLEDGRIVAALDDGGAYYKPGESKAGMETLPDGRVAFRSYGSMTYALLKCYILAGLDKTDPRVEAAVNWARNHFTLDENPGFDSSENPNAGQQGLFYYLFTMAKALDLLDVEMVKDSDGLEHDWRAELATKLLSMQREDGSWMNEAEERWMEGNPVLATSYALIALSYCAP